MSEAALFFDIFGRDHGVRKMFDDVGGHAAGMSGKLKGVGMAMGAGLLALGTAVAHSGLEKLKDQSAVTAQLEAGIKSTGDASHTSVEGLNELADSIQNYSGQTADSIGSAESLLLTFTNIKNVGANKIFDDTTAAAADMAAKLGTDAAPQAMLLGKALQDPATGLTRLMRAGVSFTAAQKDQIKSMQKSGDLMGAQKIILAEVSKEFGGAAKAAGSSLPGELKKADNAFKDMSANLLSALMPVLLNVAKAMTGVAEWASHNKGFVMALAIAVGILALAFIVLSAAAAVVASPFIWIGLAIAALIAGIVIAYNRIGWFKDGVNAVFSAVAQIVTGIVNFISTYMVPIWVAEFKIIAAIVTWLYTNIIAPYFGFIIGIIKNVVSFVITNLVPGFVNAALWIAQAIIGAINGFNRFRDGVVNAIQNAVAFVINAIGGFVQFGTGVISAFQGALSFVEGIPGRIMGALSGAGSWLYSIGADMIQGLINGVSGMISAAVGAVQNVGGAMLSGVKSFLGIHSPSTRFHDEVGVMVGRGVIDGIDSTREAVQHSVNGLISIGDGGTLRVSASTVGRQVAGVRHGQEAQQAPAPVYVQNPFTGEYLLARVDTQVGKGISNANTDLGRRPSR